VLYGTHLHQSDPQRGVKRISRNNETFELYSNSYALLIGNSEYQHWSRLQWPARDVDEIAVVLRDLGFETEVYKDLSDQDFRQVMARFLTNQGREEGAQLLIYYAGHGHTVTVGAGRTFGYVAMSNTPDPRRDQAGFEARSISMEWFLTYARKITSRHVLFAFDSCFSGTLLNVRADVTPEPIREFVTRPVREFLTAGRADEPVPDRSIFKAVLVDVLEGVIEEPIADGYLTGAELGLLMKNMVPKYNAVQHPQYGKILDPKLDKGDFVFVLKPAPPGDLTPPPVTVDAALKSGRVAYEAGKYADALDHFERAAKGGSDEAMSYLGYFYYEGLEVQRDHRAAAEWFRKAAHAGNGSAMNNLGYMYKEGQGVVRDYVEAARWLDMAGQAGEPGAIYNLGVMYQTGQGVDRDYGKAFRLFQRAAEAGDERAMNNLAYMYDSGQGVERNIKEALRWYHKAVQSGDASAMYNLGRLYVEGKVVQKDYPKAYQLFRLGAAEGNASSMNSLGHLYKEGLGMKRDYEVALHWFGKAERAGNASAMNNLGYMNERGLGLARNYAEALRWYGKGAEAGDTSAMYNLGRMYEQGLGVSRNMAEGLRWYRKAASLGDQHARNRLRQLGETE
jgi:TPR repeat protein